ncbi:MAG: VOC family protein [Rhodovarius sp.]|nr:VOC family protein [Rhodovarius sp.]MCX7932889.1 VOC family protein [Rhodovarius sp.]MDW8315546.1 VOC family protein [Rhodovarius sp.]
MRFAVDRLDHLVINCRDVEITAAWYERVLGMEREIFGRDQRTALRFGGQKINLRPHDHPVTEWPTGRVTAPGSQDLCFIVTVSAEQIVAHLHRLGVAIEAGPVEKAGALGPIESVYCRDPDGNLIEISTYG